MYVVTDSVGGMSAAFISDHSLSSYEGRFQSALTELWLTFQSTYSVWKGKYVENTVVTTTGP